jgi:hypothetical protein
MRSAVIASSVAVVLCLASVVLAANPTGPFWVQAFYSGDGCAAVNSTSFAAYPVSTCIQSEAGSIMYDCSDLSNPSRTDFTSVDCSGAGTTTSNLNQSCTFNSGNSLWATSGCVADLSALFVGNAVSLNGYNNATDCPANGPVVSYTVSTASSACAPISGAGNVVATTYDCNSTYINVLYCFDTSCSNCVVQMSTPVNETCTDANTKQFCMMGTPRPSPPVAAPVAAVPVAAPVMVSTPVAAPVAAAPKAVTAPVVKAPSAASSVLVSAALIITGCAVVLLA